MQNSPNIGERSSKCVGATLFFGFSLQFWVFRCTFASEHPKKRQYSIGKYREKLKSQKIAISTLTTPLTKNDVV